MGSIMEFLDGGIKNRELNNFYEDSWKS